MKTVNLLTKLALVAMSVFTLASCDDDSYVYYYPASPNALVTVKPMDEGSFCMQLDDSTVVYPYNLKNHHSATRKLGLWLISLL